ncbi:cell wall metabolism sensor histidine kinase WalK [Demequina sp. NBRC 110054]|uniref:sensor histidine kinase n=1 Tax=Demequina sp. NBRC 110054 TaxID=1570343 RepID=UPI000A026DAD|nr:HAMP domain-containing sensor histidine kinase [Demequina sp. NBRC 110054]
MSANRSLQRTLVLRVAAATAVGLVLATGALLWALAIHLRSAVDRDLESALELVATAERNAEGDATVNGTRLSRLLPGRALLAVVSTEGEIQVLSADAVAVDALPTEARDSEDPFPFTVGTTHYRGVIVEADALELAWADDAASPIEVQRVLLALDISADRATVRTVSLIAIGVDAAAMLFLVVVSRAIVVSSMRPLRQIASAAGRIAHSGVDEPMPRGTGFDETEAVARAVDDAIARRTRAEQAMRDFVADASHELRTPVAKIQGWSELMLSGALGEDATRDALATVIGSAEELTEVVDELALLASLDSVPRTEREAVSLADLARDVVAEAEIVAEDRALHVADLTAAPADSIVLGDRTALTRALRNLVGNALQHGAGDVSVTVATDGNDAVVTVADDGPGVPAEVAARIFDRFYTTSPGQGRHSGLGLAIVRSVARAHGGDASLLETDQGASFEVRLPRSSADRQVDVSHA